MSTRLPVLYWSDAQARWHGLIVGDSSARSACAALRREVEIELRGYLELARAQAPWLIDESFVEASLLWIRVEHRARYHDGNRLLPSGQLSVLRVPCVRGVDADGLKHCAVPHLELQFQYHDETALRELVRHYAGEALRDASPGVLALRLPPEECELAWLEVPDRHRDQAEAQDPHSRSELALLFEVAEPLLRDRRLGNAHGREREAALLAERLRQPGAPVLLVGPPQVGKSTLLAAVVRRQLRAGKAADAVLPAWQREHRWWRGSAARIVAGMRWLGEWEERCEALIAALARIDGVFVAENLLELVSTGGSGPQDSVGAFLVPYLKRGELRLGAEATSAEVEACRRLLPALLDCFEPLPVAPFEGAAAEALMRQVAGSAPLLAGMPAALAPEVPLLALRLHQRFLPQAVVPGPAVRFLRRLLAQGRRQPIDASACLREFSRETGLPELFLRDDLALPFATVEAALGARVLGQPQAVAAAAQCVINLKAGLNDPGRPLGVLLFSGPSGTGKTALALALAQYCFGAGAADSDGAAAQQRLVRLDMSEYGGADGALRLLLADAATPARWLQQIRRQPFSVVLLDEIEKAAPEVFDLLLGLLDEGRLTDPLGRTSDFRSAIVILTSNLGAGSATAPGFTAAPAGGSAAAAQAVSRFFRPEFHNRLDAVLRFEPLGPATLRAVLQRELAELGRREGLLAAGLTLAPRPALVERLLAEGYSPQHGARPLQRALERLVVTPLARWRLAHPQARDLLLQLDWDGSTTTVAATLAT